MEGKCWSGQGESERMRVGWRGTTGSLPVLSAVGGGRLTQVTGETDMRSDVRGVRWPSWRGLPSCCYPTALLRPLHTSSSSPPTTPPAWWVADCHRFHRHRGWCLLLCRMSSTPAFCVPSTPHSIAIAQAFSTSTTTPPSTSPLVSQFGRLPPPPLLGLTCTWLTATDLLTFFRTSRALVAAHHHRHIPPTSSSTSAASNWSWVRAAWSHARLFIPLTQHSLSDQHDVYSMALRFPELSLGQQPSHMCRLVLSATPQLTSLRLYLHVGRYGHQPAMPDVLDLVPHLRALEVSCESDDDTGQATLWVALPATLARHPLLHSLRCGALNGSCDMSAADVLAIASHRSLAHMDLSKVTFHHLYYQRGDKGLDPPNSEGLDFVSDAVEEDEGEAEGEEEVDEGWLGPPLCRGCTAADTVTARLRLLRCLVRTLKESLRQEEEEDESDSPREPPRVLTDMRALIRQLNEGKGSNKKRRLDEAGGGTPTLHPLVSASRTFSDMQTGTSPHRH